MEPTLAGTFSVAPLLTAAMVLPTLVTLSALLCHLLAPLAMHFAKQLRPEPRALLLLIVALAPWLFSAGVALSAIPDLVFGACDEGDRCLWTTTAGPISYATPAIAAISVLATLIVAVRVVWQVRAANRTLAMLERASARENHNADVDEPIRLVPGREPLAFSGCGKIFVAQMLRERLNPEEYRALLLHEEAHLRRHDGLLLILARLSSATYLPPLRNRLLAQLVLASEQACDQSAAEMSTPNVVAAAILKMERLLGQRPSEIVPAFADGFVKARVERLLSSDRKAPRFGMLQLALLGAIPAIFMLADLMYYASIWVIYPWVMT